MGESIRPRRFQSWLFGTLGATAMLLVGVGMFGLHAMATARRTREIGIRVALGSTRDGVIRLLLREQLSAVVGGLVAGGVASAWLVQFLRASLYQTGVYDPAVWVIAIALITTTAIAGTLVPAVRASRVDPVRALSQE
jgi:ABC-type antimicrobial peptide transport system permease subunit